MDISETIVDLQVRHPVATGLIIGAMVGFCGLQAYKIGRALGGIAVMHGDAARAASEALGG